MYSALKLRDCGPVCRLDLEFSTAATLLAGVNGIGKTTVLHALHRAVVGQGRGNVRDALNAQESIAVFARGDRRPVVRVDGDSPAVHVQPTGPCILVDGPGMHEAACAAHLRRIRECPRGPDALLSDLRTLDPDIRGLHESAAGPDRLDLDRNGLRPLAVAGSGMGTAVHVLTALHALKAAAADADRIGLLLIDDAWHGMHRHLLRPLWKCLAAALQPERMQLVASLHRWSVLAAAKSAMGDDIRVCRLEFDPGDTPEPVHYVVNYPASDIDTVLRQGIEFR